MAKVLAASIAASVLGSQAARTGTLEPLAGLAVVAYLCCVGASLYVLMPHRLVLEFRGSVLFDAASDAGADEEEALRTATGWIEHFHEKNRDELAKLGRWYTAAVLSVGVEIALWTVSIGTVSCDDAREHSTEESRFFALAASAAQGSAARLRRAGETRQHRG